jgi:predicted RNA-binding protein with PUA-like domain
VAGLAEVARAAYADATAFDPAHDGYDPKSRPDAPAWVQVDVRAVEGFPRVVTLAELRAEPALAEMVALRRGNRLSVTPVTAAEWKAVCRLGRAGRAAGARGG